MCLKSGAVNILAMDLIVMANKINAYSNKCYNCIV